MTVDEILACKIPEGNHWYALIILMDKIGNRGGQTVKSIDSLCASFTVLYDKANGEYVKKEDVKILFLNWYCEPKTLKSFNDSIEALAVNHGN